MKAVPMGLGYPPCEVEPSEDYDVAELAAELAALLTKEPDTCVHEADWACGEYVTDDVICARGREGCCGCCEADYSHTREV